MKKKCFTIFLLLLGTGIVLCQTTSIKDSTVNNLIHTTDYLPGEYGALLNYIKAGKGRQALILIPGIGFDASVFADFMEANKKKYTMYAITISGYGNTVAPPMPVTGTSYGEQSWNKSVLQGLVKLIEKEKIKDPVILGHFVQGTQLALRMAIDHPNKVKAAIIIGGPAKFIFIDKGVPKQFPLKAFISYIDKYTAPNWFKTISHQNFNEGNYLPEIYSNDSMKGEKLWQQPAGVPLPVMVRYLCEFTASDITLEFDKIKCPVLVLRSLFTEAILQKPINNYVRPQFIDSWKDASTKNPLIKVKDIPVAASFTWKDNPKKTYSEIDIFLDGLKKK